MTTQAAREYPDTFDETIDDPRSGPNGKGHGSTRFTIRRFEDIKPSTSPNYLVHGLLPREGLATIWGPPKSGKSFVAFDIAMHMALGWDYRGRRVRQGTVVYLALEGGAGFANRVEAWRRHHLANYRERVPFYLIDVPLDLINEHGDLITAIREQVEDAPAAIFVDTLNRALVGDENSPADMGKFIKASDALRLTFGGLVPVIHHCGVAGSRPRGHTSLAGANDVQISVSRNPEGVITVSVEHAKDMTCGAPFACRLERIEIGKDDNGDAMTSCVVVPVDAAPASASTAQASPTNNQSRFLDILADAVLDAPPEHKTACNIPGGRTAISREWLKMSCKAKGWFDPKASDNNNRAKVSNMVNALAGKRLIGASNLYVWDAR